MSQARQHPSRGEGAHADIHDERKIGGAEFVAHEPRSLREHTVEYAGDTHDLLAVTLNCAGEFFGVVVCEPAGLAEVRAKARVRE